MTRHAYFTNGKTDLDALRRFAKAMKGERTVIHMHPYAAGGHCDCAENGEVIEANDDAR